MLNANDLNRPNPQRLPMSDTLGAKVTFGYLTPALPVGQPAIAATLGKLEGSDTDLTGGFWNS